MVITYKIANIKIKYQGMANEYFLKNMKAYECEFDLGEREDIFVSSETKKIHEMPEGEKIADAAGKTWIKTTDGYAICEYIPEIDYYIADIRISNDFSRVCANFSDVEKDKVTVSTYHDFNLLGFVFSLYLIKNGGMNLHASSCAYKNQGIMFSAPSGTGKSTHTGLWKKFYSDDTVIINDDFPAIKFVDTVPYVYGTPWSGKNFVNKNTAVPLKAIVFLKRATSVCVKKLTPGEALCYIAKEISKYPIAELMSSQLACMDRIFKSVPVYLLECDISKLAVDSVKKEIFGGTNL